MFSARPCLGKNSLLLVFSWTAKFHAFKLDLNLSLSLYKNPYPQSQIRKRRYEKTPGRVATASQLHLQSRDYCYWDGGIDDSFKTGVPQSMV